jgi:5,10-methylenetetrahydrofolate reductase
VAEFLHNKVPGVILPDKILGRMERAGAGAAEEGIQIALEVVDAVKSKKGINGIHIMPLGCDKAVGRIVTDSGLKY